MSETHHGERRIKLQPGKARDVARTGALVSHVAVELIRRAGRADERRTYLIRGNIRSMQGGVTAGTPSSKTMRDNDVLLRPLLKRVFLLIFFQ